MSEPSIRVIPFRSDVASKVFSVLPDNGDGDFDFSRASSATFINSNGLIENAATNVPRFDYPLLDGVVSGCPSLLLEPQRSNLINYSEDFNGSGWNISNLTATANQVISPDGTLNASKLEMTGNGSLRNQSEASFNDGYAYSIFVKKGNSRYVTIRSAFFTQSFNYGFDLDNLTAETNGKIEDYGNDWYRLSITKDISGDADRSGFFYLYLPNSLGSQTSVSGNYAYFYGGQIEDGSYATSYIPTQGSVVTRLADSCSQTVPDGVINSSEGVLYLECSALSNDLSERRFGLSDGTSSNVIRVGYTSVSNRIIAVIYNGSNQAILTYTSPDITQNTKIAIKYKENDFALWVNGVERSTDSSGSVFASNTLNSLGFNVGGGSHFYSNTKEVKVYNTALTDQELATLTQV